MVLRSELVYSDKILARLDIVVTSVHNNFKAKMTKHNTCGIENPVINIAGDPTGRMLRHSPMYLLNIE